MENSQPVVGNNVGFPSEGEVTKLFVGQIPKNFTEQQVKELMEPYGPISELNIIKDKETSCSRGCAFVTYCTQQSVVDAQRGLHEKKTLAGMSHPMQVKPATPSSKEKPEERRLFVGQLSKTTTDEDLNVMFTPYGAVEDISIIRDEKGISKSAAFVRMATRVQAHNAIAGLHQSQTLPGASGPLNVRIADTEKEKEQKKIQQILSSAQSPTSILGIMESYYRQLYPPSGLASNSFGLGTQLGNPLVGNQLGNQLGTNTIPPNIALTHQYGNQPGPGTGSAFGNSQGTGGLGNLGSAVLSAAANTPGNKMHGEQHMVPGYAIQQYSTQSQMCNKYIHQKQKEGEQRYGPEGANLFIYHLPNDVNDGALAAMFSHFGNVISAKVFVDKHTNLSKCFGFVSFDNSHSGSLAIQAMNGFQIGTKRLKVQVKRPKNSNKPYW